MTTKQMSWPFMEKIELALDRKKFLTAERYLIKALKLQLSSEVKCSYFNLLAGVLHNQRKHAKALTYKSRALRLNPGDFYTRLSLVHDMMDFGKSNRRVFSYLKPIFKQRNIPTNYLHWAYDLTGELYLKLGNRNQAIEYFHKMQKIKLPPNLNQVCGLPIALLQSGIEDKDIIAYLRRYVKAQGRRKMINSVNIKMIRKLLFQYEGRLKRR